MCKKIQRDQELTRCLLEHKPRAETTAAPARANWASPFGAVPGVLLFHAFQAPILHSLSEALFPTTHLPPDRATDMLGSVILADFYLWFSS